MYSENPRKRIQFNKKYENTYSKAIDNKVAPKQNDVTKRIAADTL